MSAISSISSGAMPAVAASKQSQAATDSSSAAANGNPWKIVESELFKSLGVAAPAIQAHGRGHHHAVHDVVGAIETALDKGTDTDPVPAMLDKLDTGFENARGALQKAGFDDATIDNVITKFRSRLSDALQKESHRLASSDAAAATTSVPSNTPAAPVTTPTTPAPASTSSSSAVSGSTLDYRRRDSFSLKVQTQEGDLVTIKLRTRDALRYNSADATYSDTSVSGKNLVSYGTSRLFVDIQGNLSDSEMAAVRDVVQQAQNLASEFFSGDVQAAFADSANLHADSEQIAGFALKLSTRETLRTSTPVAAATTSTDSAGTTPALPGTTSTTDSSATPATSDAATTSSTPPSDTTSTAPAATTPTSPTTTTESTSTESSAPTTTSDSNAPTALIKYLQDVMSWARVTSDHATLVITTRTKLELVAASAELQAPPATDSTSLQQLRDLLTSTATATT